MSDAKTEDYYVAIIGPSKSGKTRLARRMCGNANIPYKPTIAPINAGFIRAFCEDASPAKNGAKMWIKDTPGNSPETGCLNANLIICLARPGVHWPEHIKRAKNASAASSKNIRPGATVIYGNVAQICNYSEAPGPPTELIDGIRPNIDLAKDDDDIDSFISYCWAKCIGNKHGGGSDSGQNDANRDNAGQG